MSRPICPSISFEFYPPKTDAATEKLVAAAKELAGLNPQFVTVTFGAGGSTKSGTLETCKLLQQECGLTVGAHLSYFGTKKDDLFDYAEMLWESGIRHLVAVRGDIPTGTDMSLYQGPEYFQFTSDFVEALMACHPFDISVGAYPEKHPDAPSMEADIIALQKKCAAGAARAITQFFFTSDIYRNFLGRLDGRNIKVPVVPGLLPIGDYTKIKSFAVKCGASVPDSLESCVAADFLATQIRDMMALNVPHIHFYTLNRADIVLAAFQQIDNRS